MFMKKVILVTIATIFTIVLSDCKKDSTTYDCTGVTATYTTHVKPILDTKCAGYGCHSPGAGLGNNISLMSFESAKSEAAQARFMGAVEHRSGFDAMPKGRSKLSDAELKTLGCWIKANYPQ